MDYNYTQKKEKPTIRDTANLKLKVCGMKKNPLEVTALQPDYMGFIFWEPSQRYFKGALPHLPHRIRKVGVFVDASLSTVLERIEDYQLLLVQLHGNENPDFCASVKEKAPHVAVIKVFSIKDNFDFSVVMPYEPVCDFFLFDTKGKLPGGNGYTFDWRVLEKYPSTKPYFLSGGIGPDQLDSIKTFLERPESKYCHALDVNSGFEIEPGWKDIKRLKRFIEDMQQF
ncbi:phosphoribosylanthranilate isomerase [Pareuzebyella sediminis]|uniref:phosphoribosylanthranilate isomerase n=1 Tax=Pareuzebyella sediminis TaxID=2607998 RepID=UPI0011EF113E|nr:phosphoribosylanthranilate isomerase [Pareuzebyella sediminis]